MPHSILVDCSSSSVFCNLDHSTIDVGRDTYDELLWDVTVELILWPIGLDEVDVASDTSRRDYYRSTSDVEVANGLSRRGYTSFQLVARLENGTRDTCSSTGSAIDDDAVDLMTILELD